MRRKRSGDAGVTIVEAAFVIPLLFMFIFGLVDLGMWTLNSNQASNAARDGARAGILAYPLRGVDVTSDPAVREIKENLAREEVVSAIQANLPEGTVDDDAIEIECLVAGMWSIDACNSVDPNPNPERVRVRVPWKWTLVTPVATILGIEEGEVQGTATMEIIGRPIVGNGGTDPNTDDPLNPAPDAATACEVSGLTAPTEVFTKGNQLRDPMEIRFSYVSGDCDDIQVVLTGTKAFGADQIVHPCGCGEPVDADGNPIQHVWEYSGSDNIWQSNGNRGVVALFDGSDRVTPLDKVDFKVT